MLDPEQIPLRDIHLPDPIGWWPLAPGWWLLAAAVLAIVLGISARLRWYRRTRVRRVAQRQLADLIAAFKEHRNGHRLAGEISALCRQIALAYCGPNAAAITGQPWLEALDALSSYRFFTGAGQALILDAPYRQSSFEAEPMLGELERWLAALLPINRGPSLSASDV